jgi:diadenosine tetraphosphate (Ap4A) HIT family hydrolase
VHWHFVPRYASPVTFAGETFVDAQFGKPLAHEKRNVPVEVLITIRDLLKQAVEKTS